MTHQEAIEIINTKGLKNHLGRYNSSRLSEPWLKANGFEELLALVNKETELISNRSLGQRFWAFERLPIPLCECGQPAKKHDSKNEWSNFCSKQCSLHSTKRADLISQTKLSQDHNEANNKRKQTMITKYGVAFNSQRDDIHHIWEKSKLPDNVAVKLTNYDWMNEQYNTNKRTASDIAIELGIFYGTVIDYCRKLGFEIRQRSNYSKEEVLLSNTLNNLGVDHQTNLYSIIHPYELDLYIPKNNIAIEINGLRWHSVPGAKEKHLEKLKRCQDKNISLLQFTDYEINNKLEIVTSIILNKTGLLKKEDARKCAVEFIDAKAAREFLNGNHLRGFAVSSHYIGLKKNNELLMVLTIGKSRFTNHDWEIVRLCTKSGTTVRGGFSKMLSFFRTYFSGSIMSYVDRRIGTGLAYEKVGFNCIGVTSPGYIWTEGNVIISRYKSQKSQLKKWLPSYDENKTEEENMTDAKYRKMWDCGNLIYELV